MPDMKYTKTIALITTLLCFLQGQGLALAQDNPNQYNYLYLTIRNGLCDNSIRTIHKDHNSFMWFGTSNGLDRYDGYELKHYSTAPRQPYQFIESNYINDIDEDDNNYLWVASEAGIMNIDLLHENLNFYKEYSGKNNNVLYSPVQALLVDDFNDLWVEMCIRDRWETYLPAFKALVQKADVREVMCAYQRLDDDPCCGNTRLLQQILRDEWGFKYLVVSDCGAIADFWTSHKSSSDAVHAAVKGTMAGTDVECGYGYAYQKPVSYTHLDVYKRQVPCRG